MKLIKKYTSLICLIMLLSNTSVYATNPYNQSDEPLPEIYAEAYIVLDADTGDILYGQDEHVLKYPASTTKLLTAYLASKELNPYDTLIFTDDIISSIPYNTSRIGIRGDEEITVNDTFHGMLLMSGNETANALAKATSGSIEGFVDLMNETASLLGAIDTHFTNAHGLYDVNHYTTAYDLALITREVITDDYVLEVMNHSTYEIPPTNESDEIRYLYQQHKMLNNKNDMRIYREDVFAGKVGYTSESGHTLVTVAKQEQRTLIVVVLKTNARNVYTDTDKLLNYGFAVPVSDIIHLEQAVTEQDTTVLESTLKETEAQTRDTISVKLQVTESTPVEDSKTDTPFLPILIFIVLLIVSLFLAAKTHSYVYKKRLKEKYSHNRL